MIHLFLVEKDSPHREMDLGLYKFNDVVSCMKAAKKRHPWITKLACNCWEFKGDKEMGPYRRRREELKKAEQGALF